MGWPGEGPQVGLCHPPAWPMSPPKPGVRPWLMDMEPLP